MNIINKIENLEIKNNYPCIRSGDTVRIHFKIKEGKKERVQVFEGVCLSFNRGGNRSSITVRKISFLHGVEKIFPLCSPRIKKIELMQKGKVRRAKLYYLRKLRGKKARIKERKYFNKVIKVKGKV